MTKRRAIRPLPETEDEYVRVWWRYGLAIWCWDRGDRDPMALQVINGYPIPNQLAPVVGDCIRGRREPNLKAVAKHKMPATNAAVAAARLAAIIDTERGVRDNAEALAEARQPHREPAEEVADSHARVRAAKKALATECGISVETLEETERALRRFVETLTKD
jgi:hypothetical protein